MTLDEVRHELKQHQLYIWQLCKKLDISKSTFYNWYHDDFDGHDTTVQTAINDLVNSTKEADNQ